jgi:hypothetical protein
MQATERDLLAQTLRAAMTAATGGADLDARLAELGWADLLAEAPDEAVPLVFGLLGETGTNAPVLNDVLLHAAGRPVGGTIPLPYTGGSWVCWDRTGGGADAALDGELPLRPVPDGEPLPLAAGRRALGLWLVGASRAMLSLARAHALVRTQFGRPIGSFQAVAHRLADTLVAVEGAEATLLAAGARQIDSADVRQMDIAGARHMDAAADDLSCLLAKAAAGQAALAAARNCQQVLGGMGFTAEHDLHRHVRRVLVLDGLLGSARELVGAAGARLRRDGSAPRLTQL